MLRSRCSKLSEHHPGSFGPSYNNQHDSFNISETLKASKVLREVWNQVHTVKTDRLLCGLNSLDAFSQNYYNERDRRCFQSAALKHHHILHEEDQIILVCLRSSTGMEGTFNRAKLMNIGYQESLKQDNYSCFVFSDGDLVPMDDRNLYRCLDKPRHLSVAVNKCNFQLPSATYFGGLTVLQGPLCGNQWFSKHLLGVGWRG